MSKIAMARTRKKTNRVPRIRFIRMGTTVSSTSNQIQSTKSQNQCIHSITDSTISAAGRLKLEGATAGGRERESGGGRAHGSRGEQSTARRCCRETHAQPLLSRASSSSSSTSSSSSSTSSCDSGKNAPLKRQEPYAAHPLLTGVSSSDSGKHSHALWHPCAPARPRPTVAAESPRVSASGRPNVPWPGGI